MIAHAKPPERGAPSLYSTRELRVAEVLTCWRPAGIDGGTYLKTVHGLDGPANIQRMDDALSPSLPNDFDLSFRDAIRQDCRAAYGLAADRIYSPQDGWGAMMFGIAVYFNLDRRFQARFLGESRFRYVLGRRRPELQTGDLRVSWNKTGAAVGAPGIIERPSGVLLELASENLMAQSTLFGAPDPVSWVIAHAGTAENGLASIHLAAPQFARNGRVVGWQESIAIFDARRPDLDFPDLAAPGLPEPAPLVEFGLAFRPDAPAVAPEEESPGSADAR
jgi:hypothetical protein